MARPALSDFDLVLEPQRLFHVAPLAEHEAILRDGLDPLCFPHAHERRDPTDGGIWCFDNLPRALGYAQSRERTEGGSPYEIWEIAAEGLAMRKPLLARRDFADDVWYLEAAVAPERVRLVSSPAPEPGLAV